MSIKSYILVLQIFLGQFWFKKNTFCFFCLAIAYVPAVAGVPDVLLYLLMLSTPLLLAAFATALEVPACFFIAFLLMLASLYCCYRNRCCYHHSHFRGGIKVYIHRLPECLLLRRYWGPPQTSVFSPLGPKGRRVTLPCGWRGVRLSSNDWKESLY